MMCNLQANLMCQHLARLLAQEKNKYGQALAKPYQSLYPAFVAIRLRLDCIIFASQKTACLATLHLWHNVCH